MEAFLKSIEYTEYSFNNDAQKIVDIILAKKVLSKSSLNDCRHISIAIVNNCNYILSWNLKHFSNAKTNKGVREIAIAENVTCVKIITPKMFLELYEGGLI